ncbi:hypothetical protein [Ruminococcus flavefaciens]|uniref:hypothetical protein n=1 Tax=Ruminococcus flavefaciens TaxID=1265 RepID=UPI00036BD28E|nr:hypothetical protein [Ruminococcus flavefaciens]
MKNFNLKKETQKVSVYENDDYTAELRVGKWGYPPKSIREELDCDGLAPFDILKVTSKKTGKSAQTRVYQSEVLMELDSDYIHKKQFKKLIWDKID